MSTSHMKSLLIFINEIRIDVKSGMHMEDIILTWKVQFLHGMYNSYMECIVLTWKI
jgi:hypothetical protein